jgi:spore germination cell wall hydrolase CwlJ-like protein
MGELTLDPTQGATFFHATYVRPDWAQKFSITTQIGLHRFYRAPRSS